MIKPTRPVVAKRATTATPREIATRLVSMYFADCAEEGDADWRHENEWTVCQCHPEARTLRDRIARAIRAERSGKGRGR